MTKVMMWGLSSAILLSYTKQAVLLFIRDPQSGSSVHAIEVEDDAHVSDIKTVISNHTDLLRDFGTNPYSLMFRADILKDAQTLSDTGIGSEAVLDIFVHREDLSGLVSLFKDCNATRIGNPDEGARAWRVMKAILKKLRSKQFVGLSAIVEWYHCGEILEEGRRSIRKDNMERYSFRFETEDSDGDCWADHGSATCARRLFADGIPKKRHFWISVHPEYPEYLTICEMD